MSEAKAFQTPDCIKPRPVNGYNMRQLFTAFGLLFSALSFGQTCFCDKDTMLKEIINCHKTKFDNKASIYWRFNCDSSWLTFESPTHKKEIIFSLGDGLQNLTGRLGYMYWTEFNKTFLITNHVISGCCDPVDYYLYDKTSGDLVKYLGRAVYVSDNRRLPFVVSITNSNYDTSSRADCNSLSIYNIDSRKRFKLPLPRGDIEKGIKNNDYLFPEDVFDTPILTNDILILKYRTDKYINGKQPKYKVIKIDLKKYCR